jgi:hypothetical protein
MNDVDGADRSREAALSGRPLGLATDDNAATVARMETIGKSGRNIPW